MQYLLTYLDPDTIWNFRYHKVAVLQDFLIFFYFMNQTHLGPLINRFKYFLLKIHFRRDSQILIDSTQANTVRSKKNKFSKIQNWQTLRRSDSVQAKTERSQLTTTARSQTLRRPTLHGVGLRAG